MRQNLRLTLLTTTILLLGSQLSFAGDGQRTKADHPHEGAGQVYSVLGDVEKPVRTGGPIPQYPEIPKQDKIEGVVVAHILIETDGSVSEATISRSLRDDLDAIALDAVRQWTFKPARLNGEAVRVHYNITINYRLGDKSDSDA